MIEIELGDKVTRADGVVGTVLSASRAPKPEGDLFIVEFPASNICLSIKYTYDRFGNCLDCVKELKTSYKIYSVAATLQEYETMSKAPLKVYTRDNLGPAEKNMFDALGSEDQKRVFLERQATYGSVVLSHKQIGRMWAAKLTNYLGIQVDDLPGYMVALMMVDMKTQRASRVFHDDNFIDGHNYLEFAKHMQEAGE